MLGIGVIGAGRISAAHATAAMALPETRLAAVAEVDSERLRQACEKLGCKGYLDYIALLQDANVDAVVVALPHWLHRPVTIDALRAGKHVLLEKPMALNTAECDEIIAAERESGKTVMVAHSQHFQPVNIEVRRLLHSGEIGNLVFATDTWYKPFHEGVRPPWFLDASQGGGMWPMNGSHMIDRMTLLLGSDVVAVKALVGNQVFGYNATDTGLAFLQFASGVCATLAHVGYREGVPQFHAEITGTEGQLRLPGDQRHGLQYWRSRGGEWEVVPVAQPEIPLRPGAEVQMPLFAAEMREFARAILEQRPPSVTSEYGRQVVRVMEACEESSRTGREVRLDG